MWFAGLADWVRAAADLGPPPSPNGKNSSIHSLGSLSGWGMEETMPVIYVRGQEVPNKRCKIHLSDRFSLSQVKSLLITPQQAAQKPNSGNNGAPASSGFSQSQVFSAIAAEHREVPWTTASIFSGYHGNTPPQRMPPLCGKRLLLWHRIWGPGEFHQGCRCQSVLRKEWR